MNTPALRLLLVLKQDKTVQVAVPDATEGTVRTAARTTESIN